MVDQIFCHLLSLCRTLDTILADKLAANEVALTKRCEKKRERERDPFWSCLSRSQNPLRIQTQSPAATISAAIKSRWVNEQKRGNKQNWPTPITIFSQPRLREWVYPSVNHWVELVQFHTNYYYVDLRRTKRWSLQKISLRVAWTPPPSSLLSHATSIEK